MKIAIIGAGAAGLAAAKHAIAQGFSCDVLEQTDKVGGTWNYTDLVGEDENGRPIHTSMYKDLRTNTPKEVLEFPGFRFPPMASSYISQEEVLKYINNYATTYGIIPYVKFNCYVKSIKPSQNNKWVVNTFDLKRRLKRTSIYDAVMVCNGHYNHPVFPNTKGKEKFQGKIIHSHDFRIAKPYTDRKVLIVGAGASGIGIAEKIATVAEKVVICYSTMTLDYALPDAIIHKPRLIEFTEKTAIFADYTEEDFDDVIYCTGYQYHFPFLSEECKIEINDNFVKPLYKHIVNINFPTMGFIGIPFRVCLFAMFDLQARFFLSTLSGHFKLPSKISMAKDLQAYVEERCQQGVPQKFFHRVLDGQKNYFDDLANTANIEGIPNYINKLHVFLCGKLDFSYRFHIVDNDNFIAEKME